jgi:hypothetical protein
MFRKLLIAAIFALSATSAFAQNTTCSDRPQGDSSNACANTRFVQSHVSPPGGTNGQVQYNNGGVFGGLTDPALTARIQPFTSGLSGAVPASGGGTVNFLRADGTFAPISSSGITIGTTNIIGGTNGYFLFNNGGVLGNQQFIPDDLVTHLGTGTSPLSNTVKDILNQPVNMSYYALNNGSNQTTGIANAIAAWNGVDQKTLVIPPGTFYSPSWPNLLSPKHQIIGQNKSYLKSDGATAFQTTPASGYYFDEIIQNVILAGNPTTTTNQVFYSDSMHQVKLIDVTICEAQAGANGISFNWSVNASIIRPVISTTQNSAATPCTHMPFNGITLGSGTLTSTSSGATYIQNPVVEFVGGAGLSLINAFSTVITGGTSESNAGGLYVGVPSFGNTIIGTDFESNSSYDIQVYGAGNTFINVDATSPVAGGGIHVYSGAVGNVIQGGRFYNLVIDSGAKNTVVIGARYMNSFTDNGTGTVLINVCNATSTSCQTNHL